MRTNFHAHTVICKHSGNELEPLIKLAIEKGYSHFGISEHMPIYTNPFRNISKKEFNGLINEYKQVKNKYGHLIKLYFGLECEYSPDLVDLVQSYYDMPEIDYLIFGNHFYGEGNLHKFTSLIKAPLDDLLNNQYENAKLALSSKLFSCYNHPDIFLRIYKKWDQHTLRLTQQIIDLSIKYNVPLEFNLNGLYEKQYNENYYQYPCEIFWKEVAKSNAPVIIGVDTHHYNLMDDIYWDQANTLIKEWNLEKNLVKLIDFKK